MRRFYILLIAIVLALAGVLVWAISPSEPLYKGKTLSEWVRASGPGFSTYETDEALLHIGTKAIPYLLKWIAYKPPSSKKACYKAANRILRQFTSRPILPDCDQRLRADNAFWALLLIGSKVDGVLPELVGILNGTDTPFAWSRAVRFLRPVWSSDFDRRAPAIARLTAVYLVFHSNYGLRGMATSGLSDRRPNFLPVPTPHSPP